MCPASPSIPHTSPNSPTSVPRCCTYSANCCSGQDFPGPELQYGNGTIPSFTLTRMKGPASSELVDDEQVNRSTVIRPPIGKTDEVRQTRSATRCDVGRSGSCFESLKISNAARKGAISPSWTLYRTVRRLQPGNGEPLTN